MAGVGFERGKRSSYTLDHGPHLHSPWKWYKKRRKGEYGTCDGAYGAVEFKAVDLYQYEYAALFKRQKVSVLSRDYTVTRIFQPEQ